MRDRRLRHPDGQSWRCREASRAGVPRGCAGHLKAGQAFLDFNATEPGLKVKIGEVVTAADGRFVEGALLERYARVFPAVEINAVRLETLRRDGIPAWCIFDNTTLGAGTANALSLMDGCKTKGRRVRPAF